MTRTLIALAAFLCLAGAAEAAPYLSMYTARSVTESKLNIEHLALSEKDQPNTGTVGACKRKTSSRVVCRYTIEKHKLAVTCLRKVTVQSHTRAMPTGKVTKYQCEPDA